MNEYPPRPSYVGICECDHKYTDHIMTDNDDRWEKGNWIQRNLLRNFMLLPQNMQREKCRECMCPMYKQSKIVDEKTGKELPEGEKYA